MLKKLAKITLTTTSILASGVFISASPSHADEASSSVQTYSPTQITKVGANSSGTAYEATGLMSLSAEVQVVVDAEVSGKVKSWKTWLKLRTENTFWVDFSNDAASKNYSIPRPKVVNTVASISVPHASIAPLAVAYCNSMADELRGQGKSDAEIFSTDRTVQVAIASALSYETTGIEGLIQATSPDDFSDFWKINLVCKGRVPAPPIQTANDFSAPPVDFKIKDIKLFLSTYSNAVTRPNPATICKKGQIKVRLTASKAGPAKFKLWTKIGNGAMTSKVIDAWASFDGNSGYKAEYVEWVSVNKPTLMQAKAEELVSAFGKSTPWKDITLQCRDVGGGGLASDTSTQDEPLAPPAKYDGELTIADSALVKKNQCPRQGQVVFKLNSNRSNAVSYSLVGSNGKSWTGTVQMFPNGPGKYQGVGAKTFNVSKTENVTFALKRVKDNKAYVLDFRAKQFICIRRNVETGSVDLKPDSNQPSSSTSVPATLVDKRKADAVKRRLEAAKKKKAAIAKRKAAKDAAIAKRKRDSAKMKAALAIAKKKRDAALKLRKLKAAQDAAIAKRKRDAQKKAAALLKFQKLTANGTAFAKRKAGAAANRRAAPSSVGTATQMRVIRRR